MTRARREDGFTLPTTVWVLAVVVILSGIAITAAVAGLRDASVHRDAERAQGAADAGADVAGYRMSKTLVAPATDGLLGFAEGTLRTVGCVGADLSFGTTGSVDAAPATEVGVTSPLATLSSGAPVRVGVVAPGANFCQSTREETLADGSRFRYAITTAVRVPDTVAATLTTPVGRLVVRQVAALGRSGGERRRVIVSYWLDLSQPDRPFVQRRYVRCPPAPSDPSDPFSGCPANPGW